MSTFCRISSNLDLNLYREKKKFIDEMSVGGYSRISLEAKLNNEDHITQKRQTIKTF